jgi:signal transduction histidine kinase
MIAEADAAELPRSGRTKMRARARLINLIGEELISDEPVAVVELVKNAYDADARKVEVRFVGDPGAPKQIVIADDGVGMDLGTVLGAWLEPGTVSKKRVDRSPSGRPYQGAKGIGRFASARLGDSLLLETRERDQDDAVFVLLNWGAFTDSSYLEDIEVEYEVRASPGVPEGTRLTIEGLRQGTWTEDSFERLHARLSRLISPFDDVSDFSILLDVPGHPEVSGEVESPKLLLNPAYMLEGQLDELGHFTGTVKLDNGEVIDVSRKLARGAERPVCGPFQVEVRAWDRDPEGLGPIAARENLSISQIRKTLDAYSGVSIYRDGFRVHPYGERGNDWLNLDLRSRQTPGRNLANNQVIAALRISRDGNPDLRDRSTREGMVKNDAHTALEDWFKRVLTLLEEARYKVRPRKEAAVRTDQLFEPFDLRSAVKEAESALGATHPVTRLMAETERQVSQGVERVQEVFSRLLMSAGLGHMVDIVIHEIGAPLGKVTRQLAILERDLEKLLYRSDLPQVQPHFQSIRAWLEQIHGLRQRLDPQTPSKRGRTSSFEVASEIEVTLELYAGLIQKQGIVVSFAKPTDEIKARMSKAALSQVVANLIDNAMFWIVQKHGAAAGGRIEVRLERLESGFSILVCDDGPGVPDSDRETIFEPYYSTKPNGIGLGLYIGRLVIEPYGRLVYRDDCDLGGAAFEARFEKGVGL